MNLYMSTRQKWLLVAVLAVALTCVLAVKWNDKPKVAGGQSKIVVTVNDGPVETDKVAIQRMKESIARFNKVYPEIEIKWTSHGYSPDSFSTRMAGGTAEDVIRIPATEGYLIERGYALDLTDFLTDWQYKDQLNKDVLAPFIRKGHIYALPIDGYMMGLLYNKKLFQEAGLTDPQGKAKPPADWDEFVVAAKKLTNKKKGIAGFGIMGKAAEAGWGFLNWVWQAGGDFEREENGVWQAVFASKEAVEALELIQDLRWQHDVLQAMLLSTSSELEGRFASAQIGMMFAAQDRIPNLVNQYGMKLEDIGVALLPAGPAGRANQMGGNYYILNPKSSVEVQEAAFKWISWKILGSMDPQRMQERGEDLRKQGQISTLTALPIFEGEIDSKAREAATPYKDVLVDFPDVWREAAKYMRPEPPFYCQQLYSEYLAPAIQAVLTKRDADPKALLTQAARGFQERFLDKVAQ
jgi:ABC-type glycerol-3-phosphate transport system substrate-binding protein